MRERLKRAMPLSTFDQLLEEYGIELIDNGSATPAIIPLIDDNGEKIYIDLDSDSFALADISKEDVAVNNTASIDDWSPLVVAAANNCLVSIEEISMQILPEGEVSNQRVSVKYFSDNPADVCQTKTLAYPSQNHSYNCINIMHAA